MRRALATQCPIRPRFINVRPFTQSCLRSNEKDDPFGVLLDRQSEDPLDAMLTRQLQVRDQPKKNVSEATRDLQKVLSQLGPFSHDDRKPEPRKTAEPSKKTQRIHTAIEKQLLNMVINAQRTHKSTAPLPRGLMGPIYGIKAEKQRQIDDMARRKTLKVDDKSVAAKDMETTGINKVLECPSSRELLQCVAELTKKQPTYYASLLKHAIEKASMSFHDPYLAISIFEHAKHHSVVSYVSGCTTDVYNAVLMMRWKLWRDVHGMLNLVEEMMTNGVGYDGETRRIVQLVVAEVEQDIQLEDIDSRQKDGQIWSMDQRRSANVMKVLVGKWLVKN